jgi:hypothetical protein
MLADRTDSHLETLLRWRWSRARWWSLGAFSWPPRSTWRSCCCSDSGCSDPARSGKWVCSTTTTSSSARRRARPATGPFWSPASPATVMVATRQWGTQSIDGESMAPAALLLLLAVTWVLSALLSYWGPRRAVSRLLLIFGSFWMVFVILSNITQPMGLCDPERRRRAVLRPWPGPPIAGRDPPACCFCWSRRWRAVQFDLHEGVHPRGGERPVRDHPAVRAAGGGRRGPAAMAARGRSLIRAPRPARERIAACRRSQRTLRRRCPPGPVILKNHGPPSPSTTAPSSAESRHGLCRPGAHGAGLQRPVGAHGVNREAVHVELLAGGFSPFSHIDLTDPALEVGLGPSTTAGAEEEDREQRGAGFTRNLRLGQAHGGRRRASSATPPGRSKSAEPRSRALDAPGCASRLPGRAGGVAGSLATGREREPKDETIPVMLMTDSFAPP